MTGFEGYFAYGEKLIYICEVVIRLKQWIFRRCVGENILARVLMSVTAETVVIYTVCDP